MIRRPLLAVVPALAVAAGGTAIAVAPGDASPARRPPRPAPVLVLGCGVAPVPARPPAAKPAPAAPDDVLKAFGVLRRPAEAADALPRDLAEQLRARGVAFDPAAARLLRSDGHGADAWIVPTADVTTTLAPGCETPPVLPSLRPALPPRPVPPRAVLRRPRPMPAVPVPVPAPHRPTAPGPPPAPAPPPAAALAPPAAPIPARPPLPIKPQPGVVVVAHGGAPAGGTGTLPDLLAGRAPALVTPCAGPDHRMAGISGVVPDGVDAAYLTAHDGSAVRADVKDNGYAFLVVPKRRPVLRYLVWTARDGTPHVQPVVIPPSPARLCRGPRPVLLTPPAVLAAPAPALPSRPRRGH